MLSAKGANVNAQGGHCSNAPQSTSNNVYVDIVQMHDIVTLKISMMSTLSAKFAVLPFVYFLSIASWGHS